MVVFRWRDQLIHLAHSQTADTQVDEREMEPVEATRRVTMHKNDLGVWVASPDDAMYLDSLEKQQQHLSPSHRDSRHHENRSQSIRP
jgi:hypothetical protein